MDEDFCRQLEAASESQVLMEDFDSPDICWRNNTTKNKQSRRILESTDGSVLTQVAEDPTRNGVLLNFITTNRGGLVGDEKVRGHYLAVVIMRLWSSVLGKEEVRQQAIMDFRRANVSLFNIP